MVVTLSDMHPYAWVWLLRVVDTAVCVSGHLEVTAVLSCVVTQIIPSIQRGATPWEGLEPVPPD